MNKFVIISLFFFLFACSNSNKNANQILILHSSEKGEVEMYSYLTQEGDTVITEGKYVVCFSDTIKTMGFVYSAETGWMAIDNKGDKLFDVYTFDNGPDYESEGLFRILKNNKMGFANSEGKIIIEPAFDFVYPFEDGKAKFGVSCKKTSDGEHEQIDCLEWYFIDKQGRKII